MAETAKERIRFACEQCDQLLSIGVCRIGQEIVCPKCTALNIVPESAAAALQIVDRKLRKENLRHESKEDLVEYKVYDDDTEFVFEAGEDEGYYRGRVDATLLAVPRSVLYFQGALLGVVAIGAFVIGWIVGSIDSGPSQLPVEDNTPRVVRGTLEFIDKSDRKLPDAGSVVILVPQESRPGPGEKAEVEGLRPDDPLPEDALHPGLQKIQVMGGAYARADVSGAFRMQVPRRGRYFLLIISGNSQRGNKNMNRDHLAQMGRYFTPANELVGQRQFRWTEEKIGRDVTLDYVFEES